MKKAALILMVALTISVFANAQTRVEIKPADLPKAVTENIAKDYNGFAIQNAYKVTSNNQSAFEVVVAKGSEKEKLEYSSTGAFVKKAPVASVAAQTAPIKKAEPAKKSEPAKKQEPAKK